MKKLYWILFIITAVCPGISGTEVQDPLAGTATISNQNLNSDTLDISKLMSIGKFSLELIPPSSGVQFYRNGIVFLSHTRSEVNMVESHTSFGTIEAYFAVFQDTSTGKHTIFSVSDSWEVPCEAITFNSDYSLMYYTKKPGNKDSEKIFQAKYQLVKNGKRDWVSDAKPLSFCSDKSIYTHPALSADGEKIVFASNRKESIGGLDLFISRKEGSSWSSPENLGAGINTSGNELYPFIDQDTNLFFSSDGISGFGGYDIYFCRYNGTGWDKPVNLSKKINTPDDDIAFTISKSDGKSAFFTTRSKKGNRSARLFKVTFRNQYAQINLTNLSGAFKYLALATMPAVTASSLAENQATVKEPGKEVAQNITKQEPVTSKPPAKTQTTSTSKPANQNAPVQKQPVPAPTQAKTAAVAATASPDAVVYRVQFASNMKSKGSYDITFGGKTYKTFEYLYNGAYRSCAGEFSTLGPATNLQTAIKKGGYPDAFVVAFRNNVRVTDPALFKK